MIMQTHWRAVPNYEPWNPTQKAVTRYTGLPGGYSTFYYNREPNVTQTLDGALGVTQYGAGHIIAFILVAAGLGTAIGYAGARLLGS